MQRNVAQRGGESVRIAGDKRGGVGESKTAGVAVSVVVIKATPLASEFQRVIPAQIIKSVRENEGRIRSALGKSRRSAHVDPAAADGDLRETDSVRHAIVNIEAHWIEFRIRTEKNVNAIKAKASFVHDSGTKDTSLVQGENLTV